jgi:hypothetical protein
MLSALKSFTGHQLAREVKENINQPCNAFPNVSIPVLIHEMRIMGFHHKYTNWITSKSKDHHTVIAFDDFISPPFKVKHGLDQGCNLSPFLYNCYSAGQMKACNNDREELGNTYMDDGVCGAWGDSL